MDSKRIAAENAVEYINDGMIVGLGTGSTAYWAIQKLGERIKQGLNIKAIATSNDSEILAKKLGIKIVSFGEIEAIDITIDGADEVDKEWNLIKGGGGALLREKIVAVASKKLIIIIDESKRVDHLGKFLLPVEIVKFGFEMTMRRLNQYECNPKLRLIDNKPFITDNGNYIIDCDFGRIDRPQELHNQINLIPGVVENGLFVNLAKQVIVGFQDGTVKNLTR
jgi:ribose 5-phosphate isomerase A